MNFSLGNGSFLWLTLGIVVAVTVAAWAYRFALPPLSLRTRGTLWLLRALAVSALLLLLARPLLSLAEKSRANEVVILEDRSLSMALPGDQPGESRAQAASRAVERLKQQIGDRYSIRHWVFASQAHETVGDSIPQLERAATALGDAVSALAGESLVAAVVVVSDGVANRGRDPVQSARELGKPVSAVMIAGAGEWDASLEEVAVNPTSRVGQTTPMEVRLSHSGDEPRRAKLTVSDATGILAERDVVLPPGGSEIIERMNFVPRKIGLSYYRVRLDAGPRERTAEFVGISIVTRTW